MISPDDPTQVTDDQIAREEYEHRAAMMEYEGGLSREEAEKRAREETGYAGK